MNDSMSTQCQEENKHFPINNVVHSFKEYLGLNKARIYNLQQRKKPAELVRKDLISAMKMADHETLNRDHYLRILDPWREEWEKGVQVPVNTDSLPKPVIKHKENYEASPQDNPIPDGLSLLTLRDNSACDSFKLSKTLIKYDDCLETAASYELDLHDICWLQSISKSLDVKISDLILEDTINELEQQCARNIKEQHMGIEYDDHIVCDVCQCPDAEDGNEMVFCEICNICVHQACYGIVEIPPGDWICNSCRDLGSKKNMVCVLCPNVGGALKPTTKTNRWAHVSCAYWIPEVKFVDLKVLEPIETRAIPNWRWNLVCSLCNVKKGAPIMCDEKHCRTSYHVSCAFKQKLKLKILLNEKSEVKLKSYCLKHSQNELEHLNHSNKSSKEVDFINRTICDSDISPKNVNPQYEFWKYVDINKVFQEISNKYLESENQESHFIKSCKNITAKVLQQIIDLIYNYWKLKRISNYGNSLIKLTFAQKFEKEMQFHQIKLVEFRYHLERLRTLSYMLFRREKIKKNWISTQKEIFLNSCKLFTALDQSPETECEIPSQLSSERNFQLFNQIMRHHNIYQPKIEDSNNPPTMTPIHQSICLTPKNEKPIESIEQADFLKLPATSLSKNSAYKKSKDLDDQSITNLLIRQIKRLRWSGNVRVRSPKMNPYARVYGSSTNKRKNIDFDQDSSQSIKENDELNLEFANDDNLNSRVNSTSPFKQSRLLRSERRNSSDLTRFKRKLDFSNINDDEPLRSNQSNVLNLSPRLSQKQLKLDLDTDSKLIEGKDETKRVYNFRRISSNDFAEKQELRKNFSDNESPQSNQKEKGTYIDLSPQKAFFRSDSIGRNSRLNRRDKYDPDINERKPNGSHSIPVDKFLDYTNRDVPKNHDRRSLRQTTINEHFKPNNSSVTKIKYQFRQQNRLGSSR